MNTEHMKLTDEAQTKCSSIRRPYFSTYAAVAVIFLTDLECLIQVCIGQICQTVPVVASEVLLYIYIMHKQLGAQSFYMCINAFILQSFNTNVLRHMSKWQVKAMRLQHYTKIDRYLRNTESRRNSRLQGRTHQSIIQY